MKNIISGLLLSALVMSPLAYAEDQSESIQSPDIQASVSNTVEVAGVKYDNKVKIGTQDLKLNGAGIRYKVIFKVYTVGLYLPSQKTTSTEVLNSTGNRRVRVVMLRDLTNTEFSNGFMTGLQKNISSTEQAKYSGQLETMTQMFASIPKLTTGDSLTIDWINGVGTVVKYNGKKISAPLPDIGFYNAILEIWLGPNPIDSTLKKHLLGEK